MKHTNHVFSFKFYLCWVIVFSVLTISFQPHPINKERCVHSCHFEDIYILKKNELGIIRAIKHHGYEVKRGTYDTYGELIDAHHWRIININTPEGHIDEVVIKIEKTKDEKTKLTAISICINQKLTEQQFDNRVKLYRKYIKMRIINNIKTFKG